MICFYLINKYNSKKEDILIEELSSYIYIHTRLSYTYIIYIYTYIFIDVAEPLIVNMF